MMKGSLGVLFCGLFLCSGLLLAEPGSHLNNPIRSKSFLNSVNRLSVDRDIWNSDLYLQDGQPDLARNLAKLLTLLESWSDKTVILKKGISLLNLIEGQALKASDLRARLSGLNFNQLGTLGEEDLRELLAATVETRRLRDLGSVKEVITENSRAMLAGLFSTPSTPQKGVPSWERFQELEATLQNALQSALNLSQFERELTQSSSYIPLQDFSKAQAFQATKKALALAADVERSTAKTLNQALGTVTLEKVISAPSSGWKALSQAVKRTVESIPSFR